MIRKLLLLFAFIVSHASAYHIDSISDELKAECRLYKDIDMKGEYSNVLFNSYLCHHVKLLSDIEFSNVVGNFIFHIKEGNSIAVRDADIESAYFLVGYFKDGTDSVLLSAGRTVLGSLISYAGDEDGRYHFLLGLSYLSPKVQKDAKSALRYLKIAADKNHPLAAAVAVHIYEGHIDEEVKDRELALEYREVFKRASAIIEYNTGLESAISYIVKKGLL